LSLQIVAELKPFLAVAGSAESGLKTKSNTETAAEMSKKALLDDHVDTGKRKLHNDQPELEADAAEDVSKKRRAFSTSRVCSLLCRRTIRIICSFQTLNNALPDRW
jgi:hypothetical protein